MPHPNPLSPLMIALAGLYAAENRPGGYETARALLQTADIEADLPHHPEGPIHDQLMAALAGDAHPLAPLIRAAEPYLRWEFSSLGGRIRDDIARGMMQAEIIGPGAIFEHASVNVGLFVQGANLDYVTRRHAAEETFIVLGGGALWQRGDEPQHFGGVGAVIHHPSMMPHTDCTRESPLLAAWRWTGDISVEGYTLTG